MKEVKNGMQNIGHKSLQTAINKIVAEVNKTVVQHREDTWLSHLDEDHGVRLMDYLNLDEDTIIASFLSNCVISLEKTRRQVKSYKHSSSSSNVYKFEIDNGCWNRELLTKLWHHIKENHWCENINLNNHLEQVCNHIVSCDDLEWTVSDNTWDSEFIVDMFKDMIELGLKKSKLLYARCFIHTSCYLGKSVDNEWIKKLLFPLLTDATKNQRYEFMNFIIGLRTWSGKTETWTELIKWLVLRIDFQIAIKDIKQWFQSYARSHGKVDWVVDFVQEKGPVNAKTKRQISFMIADYLINRDTKKEAVSSKCVKFVNNHINVDWSLVQEN